MSEPTITPSADQTASSEPRLAQHETELATNPIGDESSTAEKPATMTETATQAASAAASSAATTAANMKDNVFSMFGGGQKKEKKEEEEVDEPSGSSKAKKEEEGGEVSSSLQLRLSQLYILFTSRQACRLHLLTSF